MASKIKVDEIEESTSTANVTLRSNIVVPTGKTLTVADGIANASIADLPASKITSGELANARVADLPTSKITSGTFTNARISAGSVTQHVSSFDDNKIVNDLGQLALHQSIDQNKAAFGLQSVFVDTFQDDTGLDVQTTCDRNTTGEYMASIVPSGAAFSNDVNTKLLMHSNTSDGSTTFTDSSTGNHTLTGFSGAEHDTANYKFGTTSVKQTTSGGGVYATNHADFAFGTGAFTIEAWFKTTATTGEPGMWFKTASQTSVYCRLNNSGQLIVFEEIGNTMYWLINGSGPAYNDGVWHHVAMSRGSGEATRLSLDGALIATGSGNRNTDNSGNQIIGGFDSSYNGELWLDEFRISNSERYPSNPFTPPTEGTTVNATGNFTSVNTTANASTTSASLIVLYTDQTGTNALNTDIIGAVSANGGTNFATATLVAKQNFSTGIKMALANDVAVTAGTSMKYKVSFANQSGSKEARIVGVALLY